MFTFGWWIALVLMIGGLWACIWGGRLALAVAIIGAVFVVSPAFGHDHNRPELNEWLKGLHAKGGAWCCNGDDTDEIEDWEAGPNGYRVKHLGQWYDVPADALVEGPNVSGTPLLWMYKGWGEKKPRCFMPGTLS